MPEKMTKDDFVLKSGASHLGEAPLYSSHHWRGKAPFDAFTVAYARGLPNGPVQKVLRWEGRYIGDVDTLEHAAEVANQWIEPREHETRADGDGFREVTMNDFAYDVRWCGSPAYTYDPDGPDRAIFRIDARLRGREWDTVLFRNGERIGAYPNVGEALKSLNAALRSIWRKRQVEKAAREKDASVAHAAKQPLKSFPPNPNDALEGKWVRVDAGHWVLMGSRYSVQWQAGGDFCLHSSRDGVVGRYDSFCVAQTVAECVARTVATVRHAAPA